MWRSRYGSRGTTSKTRIGVWAMVRAGRREELRVIYTISAAVLRKGCVHDKGPSDIPPVLFTSMLRLKLLGGFEEVWPLVIRGRPERVK